MNIQETLTEANGTMLLLFPTPIFIAMIPDHEILNPEIKQVIQDREKNTPARPRSGYGGWQSSTDMHEWGGEAFQQVLDSILDVVGTATVGRGHEVESVTWKTNCWGNINRNGDGNRSHIHPGCFWSACYYVDDGGANADVALGGQFIMEDPRGAGAIMYEERLTFPGKHGGGFGGLQAVSPRNGMAIVFPSWLTHNVNPYMGTEERISVAMNFAVDTIKYSDD